MAALHCLKDEGVEVGLSRKMGLRQRLFHFLDLHQTQGPVLSWMTQQTHHVQSETQAMSCLPEWLHKLIYYYIVWKYYQTLTDNNKHFWLIIKYKVLHLISSTDQWSSAAYRAPLRSGSGRRRSARGCGSKNSLWRSEHTNPPQSRPTRSEGKEKMDCEHYWLT